MTVIAGFAANWSRKGIDQADDIGELPVVHTSYPADCCSNVVWGYVLPQPLLAIIGVPTRVRITLIC